MHHLPHVPNVSSGLGLVPLVVYKRGGNISRAQHGIWNVRWDEGQSSEPHNMASSIC